MRCPFCGHEDTQVKDSRSSEDGAAIRRRRSCALCGGRFTTFERIQLRELTVVKKNGERRPFDRDKLERSIAIAVRKRPVSQDDIEHMVTRIVQRLEVQGDIEITSRLIGQEIMTELAKVDQVAYVRFASVYRDFAEVKDFEEFLGRLGELD